MIISSKLDSLTIYNAAAPDPTLRYLLYALIGGSVIIFPALAYLLIVFKVSDNSKLRNNSTLSGSENWDSNSRRKDVRK